MVVVELRLWIRNQLEQVLKDIDLEAETIVGLLTVLVLKQLSLLVQFFLCQEHVVDELVDVVLALQHLL